MLKAAGAAVIVLACGWYGITVSQKYAVRPRQLRMLISALLMLEMEIVYASTYLPEALQRVSGRTSPPISALFYKAAEVLNEDYGFVACEAWKRSLHAVGDELHLTDADRDILHNFGAVLGISEKEEQIKNFKLTREQLAYQEKNADKEREKNERLWRTMGFLVGATLALILI